MAGLQETAISANDLPITFEVKYLGHQPAKGLWGIKHTRRPVDNMVNEAKTLPTGVILPFVKLEISLDGLRFWPLNAKKVEPGQIQQFNIDTISYGVQDLIYTRVFSMIVVGTDENKTNIPFDCHAFVCDSRIQARSLTYALAAAFQEFGKRTKEESKNNPNAKIKKFAIDLRSPEELEKEAEEETEA